MFVLLIFVVFILPIFLGNWDRQSGLDESTREHYKKSLWNANEVLKVVTVIEPPFVSVELTPVGLKYYGYCIDLLQEIMNHLKLKYEIYNSTGYGSLMDDNWNGAVGEVVYGWVKIGRPTTTGAFPHFFFRKTHRFLIKKTKFSYVLRNLIISVALYGRFEIIKWWKIFTVRTVISVILPDTDIRSAEHYQFASKRYKTWDLSVLSGWFSFHIINIGRKKKLNLYSHLASLWDVAQEIKYF